MVDGVVGPLTWASLFPARFSPQAKGFEALPVLALGVACTQIGVVEDPPIGSNKGPQINQYLASIDAKPGNPWCAAFVYWCFSQAAASIGKNNPVGKTASALGLWEFAASNPNAIRITQKPVADTCNGFGVFRSDRRTVSDGELKGVILYT